MIQEMLHYSHPGTTRSLAEGYGTSLCSVKRVSSDTDASDAFHLSFGLIIESYAKLTMRGPIESGWRRRPTSGWLLHRQWRGGSPGRRSGRPGWRMRLRLIFG
jgi:hypothetical protein